MSKEEDRLEKDSSLLTHAVGRGLIYTAEPRLASDRTDRRELAGFGVLRPGMVFPDAMKTWER